MAITMIELVNEVLRSIGSKPDKTAISETDDTAYILDKLNEGLEDIYRMCPTEIFNDGTLTLPPSTRVLARPSNADVSKIPAWSWRINDADGDKPLEIVTEEFIIRTYPGYETDEAIEPQFVYLTNDDIGFYPLLKAGESDLTIQFKYPALFTKLTNTTDTIPFEDRSEEVKYIKLYAQMEYEIFKAIGQPGITGGKLMASDHRLKAQYAKTRRIGLIGHRVYG